MEFQILLLAVADVNLVICAGSNFQKELEIWEDVILRARFVRAEDLPRSPAPATKVVYKDPPDSLRSSEG